jgi:hypothetical protein
LQKYGYILLLLFSLKTSIKAQEIDDAQLWLNTTIEKRLPKKQKLQLSFATRFANNISWRNYQLIQINYQKQFLPGFKYALGLRVYQQEQLDYTRSKVRLMAELSYVKKIKGFDLSNRLRYQWDRSLIYNYETALIPAHKWRYRLELSYRKLKPFEPFVSGEIWYDLRSQYRKLNNFRTRLGINYKLDKRNAFTIAGIYDKPFNRLNGITNAYILQCSYRYAL